MFGFKSSKGSARSSEREEYAQVLMSDARQYAKQGRKNAALALLAQVELESRDEETLEDVQLLRGRLGK